MSIFKDNDIRGLYPGDWNRDTAYRIGACLPEIFEGKNIVIGRDGRESSDEILEYIIKGLMDQGTTVTDIGQVDTPAVYFAIGHYHFDGGIMITASHNPVGYNGVKITGKNCVPIERTSGLIKLEDLVNNREEIHTKNGGALKSFDISSDYVQYIKKFQTSDKKIKAVFDCSNGSAGRFIHNILSDFSGESIIINSEIDGTFPNHGPNPVLPENLSQVKEKVLETGADLGFCFDGDADRIVVIDRQGNIVSPDLLTAIIGLYYLRISEEEIKGNKKILVDIRSSNSVSEYLSNMGADVGVCPVGHAKIKKLMREEDALFAGELTGHYYYRENYYCDSAWISIFRVLTVLSSGSKTLFDLKEEILQYHFSGELSFKVDDADAVINKLLKNYGDAKLNNLDGYRFDYPDWWFIIRKSGTEPLIRLVAEAETAELLEEKTKALVELIV